MKSFTASNSAFICACTLIFILFTPADAYSQSVGAEFFFQPDSDFKIITKYNLRLRKDNRYLGSTYREERQVFNSVSWMPQHSGTSLSGTFYLLEELKHDGREIAKKVDIIADVDYMLQPRGTVIAPDMDIFPLIRSFPVFPGSSREGKLVEPGAYWEEFGELFADPLNKGVFTKIRFLCEYRYEGIHSFNGVPSHRIFTRHALRYRAGQDPYGDDELLEVSGSRQGYVYIGLDSNAPFFIQTNINETYRYRDATLSQTGFAHTWYKTIPLMDRRTVIADIRQKIEQEGLEDEVTVSEKEGGVALELGSLHFVPDQARLLPGESGKVGRIAEILKTVPDRSFLVEGHTADVGSAQSQLDLSVERAEVIAELLKKSGIAPERIIYKGWGGTRPAAPNDTDEGRARNRRVEITILED